MAENAAPSKNPISPKAPAAGLGALAGVLLLTIATAFVDIFTSGITIIPEPYQSIAQALAAVIGAILGAYVKTDGLRLPTLEPEAVAKLPDPEQQLHDAAFRLSEQNGPLA
jgi:hypothetical protein